MTATHKGLALGAIQIAVVLSLSGKLIYDRSTLPRVWALAGTYDPEMPIRGRYLAERLRLPAEGFPYDEKAGRSNSPGWNPNRSWAHLQVRNGQLIATFEGPGEGAWVQVTSNDDGSVVALLSDPVLVFVPENAQFPALKTGQEVWVEVTMPPKGPPRPIQLGIKQNGVLRPLKVE